MGSFVFKILASEPEFNSPDYNNIILDLNGDTTTVSPQYLVQVDDDVEFDIGSSGVDVVLNEGVPIRADENDRTISCGIYFEARSNTGTFNDVLKGIDFLDGILKESTDEYIRESSGGFSMVKPGRRYWLYYSPDTDVVTPKCFLLKTGEIDRSAINTQMGIIQAIVKVPLKLTTSHRIYDELRYLTNGVANGTFVYGQRYWTSSVWVTNQNTNFQGWNLGLDLSSNMFDLLRPAGSYPQQYIANLATPTDMNYGLEYLVSKTSDGNSPFNATYVSGSTMNGATVTLVSRDILSFGASRFDKHRFMFGFQYRNIKSGNAATDMMTAIVEVWDSVAATWTQFGSTISCGANDGAVGTWVTKSWSSAQTYNLPYYNAFSQVKPKFRITITPKNTSTERTNNSGFSVRHVGFWIFPPDTLSTNEFGNVDWRSKYDYDLTLPSEYISVPGNWYESIFMFNTKGTQANNLRLTLNASNSFNAGGSSSPYYLDEAIIGIRRYDRPYAHTVYYDFLSDTNNSATGTLQAANTSEKYSAFNNKQIVGILPPNQARYKIFFEAMSSSYIGAGIDYSARLVPNPTQLEVIPTANLTNTANLVDCGMLILPKEDVRMFIGSDEKEFLTQYLYFYLAGIRSTNSSGSNFDFVFQNLWMMPAEQIMYFDIGRDGTNSAYLENWVARYNSSEQTGNPITIDSLYCDRYSKHYLGKYNNRYHQNIVTPRGNINPLYIHGTEGVNKYPTQIAVMTKEAGSNLPQKLFHMIPTVVYAPSFRV